MMSTMRAWTDDEKAVIQTSMEEVYKVFVGRVAAGRGKTPEQIQPIAQGHVWTGVKAKELGLVDELGGLDAALTEARKLGSVDASTDLEIYPAQPTLRDFLAGYGMVHAPYGVAALVGLGVDTATATAMLAQFDPETAESIGRLAELAISFNRTAIQTVAALPSIR